MKSLFQLLKFSTWPSPLAKSSAELQNHIWSHYQLSYVHVCNLMTKNLISTIIILCVTVDKINNNFLNPLQEYNSFVAPHPLKEAAGERPIVMLPLILYSDDTSGNKSKQWNKFDSWCVKLAGLRNEENMKLGNIFHISSSNKVCIIYIILLTTTRSCYLFVTNYYIYTQVDCIELAEPMVKELECLETNGVIAFDAFLSKEVLIVAPVLCFTCDNPRASEITNHLGPGSRMFCRICMVNCLLYY